MDKLVCPECPVTFTRKYSQNRHVRMFHPHLLHNVSQGKKKCPECEQTFFTVERLADHIQCDHCVQMTTEQMVFYTEEDFNRWKCREENNSVSFFVLIRTQCASDDGVKVAYYGCNRSGVFESNAKLRRPKVGGSIKIGRTCPANIKKVTVTNDDAVEISVTYQSTHFGHQRQPEKLYRSHLRTPDHQVRVNRGGGVLGDVRNTLVPHRRDLTNSSEERERLRQVLQSHLNSLVEYSNDSNLSAAEMQVFIDLVKPIRATVEAVPAHSAIS